MPPFDADLAARLRALGSPTRAAGARAYLKTTDPFFGVDMPTVRRETRALAAARPPRERAEAQAQVAALWAHPEREMRYAALEWARRFPALLGLEALPLFERMIREGAWWDTVDTLAAHLVGRLLREHRREMKPVLETWIGDGDLWIRRAALLAHLTHKGDTDEAQLFDHCLRLAPERGFFIRKALGWALRAHSKVRPEAVRAFLERHEDRFSGLTLREGRKGLARLSGA